MPVFNALGKETTDHWQTPAWAVDLLAPYLPLGKRIWEPCQGKGFLRSRLLQLGFDCLGSDLLTGQNALTWEPEEWDLIVTNPPFSLKNSLLKRFVRLGKPFALLLPIAALESQARQAYWRQFDLQLVLPPERIDFLDESNQEGSANVYCAWFCKGLGLPRMLNWANREEPEVLRQERETEAIQGSLEALLGGREI